MKKILLLGGSRYLVPLIETIHRLGYYAITCDYLPDNVAHRYADESHNISILDKDKVLALGRELKIDGVLSFACDPGVVTAAYVAEQMGLPFQGPYESVRILQDKGLFRQFLQENGFNCPRAKSYDRLETAMQDADFFRWPVMVKAVDSAGSKGVGKAGCAAELPDTVETALSVSHSGRFIVEEFIEFSGYHSDSDVFTVDGEVVFCPYSDQKFDVQAENPFTPVCIIWPSTMRTEAQGHLTKEIQRLMHLLHMRTGIYNVESCVGSDGRPYIMEVSPRGGGDRIAEIQYLATGINLMEAEIRKAVGDKVDEITPAPFDGVWCEMVVHNIRGETGIFERLDIDPQIQKKYVKMVDLAVVKGDHVGPFTGANKSLGDIFLRFDTREELETVMARHREWMKIVLV